MGLILPYKGKTPRLGEGVFVAPTASIIGDVEIGAHSSIWFNTVIRGDVYYIRIGCNTSIQDGSVIHVTTDTYPTIIGDNVTVGHNVTAHGCTIHNGCLIGMGAILLDNCEIGEQSLVAAGTLVPMGMKVPPRSLVAGLPAKIKRQLTEEDLARMEENWRHYVDLKNTYLEKR
ncbi:MAG: gamma carbonic anhydrase family protein [Acidobacteriota bacterium]|nr:gamma carbonic anhydrase family protein [Blastocatellia bacterium]MDW8412004.1 gamma carbonic anhydrase family protein [Acidobacteriota bacterium]